MVVARRSGAPVFHAAFAVENNLNLGAIREQTHFSLLVKAASQVVAHDPNSGLRSCYDWVAALQAVSFSFSLSLSSKNKKELKKIRTYYHPFDLMFLIFMTVYILDWQLSHVLIKKIVKCCIFRTKAATFLLPSEPRCLYGGAAFL